MLENLSFENITQSIKDILSNRLDNSKVKQFRKLLQQLKENYKTIISKQYIKNTLFDDKSQEFQKVLNTRINRVLKKAEIKTEKKARFFKELKSQKGILFFEYRKKYLTFLIV